MIGVVNIRVMCILDTVKNSVLHNILINVMAFCDKKNCDFFITIDLGKCYDRYNATPKRIIYTIFWSIYCNHSLLINMVFGL